MWPKLTLNSTVQVLIKISTRAPAILRSQVYLGHYDSRILFPLWYPGLPFGEGDIHTTSDLSFCLRLQKFLDSEPTCATYFLSNIC